MKQELTKQNQQLTPQTSLLTKEELILTGSYKALTKDEKEIAEAALHPRINEMPEDGFKAAIIGLVVKTHLNCGQKIDDGVKGVIDLTVDELCRDMLKYNCTLSFQEIEIAFSKGWKNEYGEYFGLNNKTYFMWVNAYTWNEKRAKAKKAIQNAINKVEVKPELTDKEKEKIIVDGILNAWEDFKNNKILPTDAGNVKYNYLDSKGLIPFTKERKQGIKNRVVDYLKQNAINDPNKNKSVDTRIKEALNDLSVNAECKRMALIEYFKECDEMEIDLKHELLTKN